MGIGNPPFMPTFAPFIKLPWTLCRRDNRVPTAVTEGAISLCQTAITPRSAFS